jgi:hypothetical protein
MKKQLRFLYRYFTTSRRWRRWANRQNLLILVFSAIFLSALSWTAPLSVVEGQHTERPAVPAAADAGASLLTGAGELSDALQATPLPTQPANQTVTPTPYPPEFLENSDQTIGITLAGAILVLIVIFGVLNFLPGSEKK